MPEQIGAGEGFCRTAASVITIDGAAATRTENIDIDIPNGYVALIHMVKWLRDGNFNAGVVDYEVMSWLYANQVITAQAADLSNFEDRELIDFYNQSFAFQAADYGAIGNGNTQITTFPKPVLIQKGRLRHLAVTGGTLPANNYIGVKIWYELSKVSPQTLATLLSGALD